VILVRTDEDGAYNITGTNAANLADAPVRLFDPAGNSVENTILVELGPGGDFHVDKMSDNLGLGAKETQKRCR
jgi:hypothetical protein